MSRRLVDVAVAGLALVLLSPLLAAIAVAVRLTSGRPVIYRARRAGRDGQPFTMLKFRTMRVSAGPGGSAITAYGDSRVLSLGARLRRWKLDELPQLVNILRGEMSVVGPRPEDPSIVARRYGPEHLRTLDVLPGLTSPGSLYGYTHGEAMLTGDDPEAAYAERLLPVKVALDLVYLSRRGPWYDLRLVARTAWVIAGIAAGRRRFAEPPEMVEARALSL
jgi:lipopolysaccharide/colanic/teichoic acid biosynthesis glycosyltransferase